MNSPALAGRRILVVEDEYFVAMQIGRALTDAGAEVIGPTGTLQDALAVLSATEHLDAAVLDVNLHGEMVYPLADALAAREVPFLFATAYDGVVIPERFGGVAVCGKPPSPSELLAALNLPALG